MLLVWVSSRPLRALLSRKLTALALGQKVTGQVKRTWRNDNHDVNITLVLLTFENCLGHWVKQAAARGPATLPLFLPRLHLARHFSTPSCVFLLVVAPSSSCLLFFGFFLLAPVLLVPAPGASPRVVCGLPFDKVKQAVWLKSCLARSQGCRLHLHHLGTIFTILAASWPSWQHLVIAGIELQAQKPWKAVA